MPKASWVQQGPRGGNSTPLEREVAAQVKQVGAVATAAQLQRLGQPTGDPTLQGLVAPIVEEIGRQMAERLRTTGEPPSPDEVTSAIKAAVGAKILKTLDGPDPGAAGPQTAQDVLAMAKGAADIHRDAAATAMEQAEQERQRRQEAEESLGQAAQAARQDEGNKWAVVLELSQKNHDQVLTMMQQLTTLQLTNQQQSFQSTIDAINQKLDLHTAAQQRELEAKERLHAADLAAKEREAEFKLKELDYQHKLTAGPRSATPQDVLNQIWAEQKGRELKLEVDDKEAEAAARRERSALSNDILADVKDSLPNLLKGASQFLGGPAPVARHGIAPTPPPPPAEAS